MKARQRRHIGKSGDKRQCHRGNTFIKGKGGTWSHQDEGVDHPQADLAKENSRDFKGSFCCTALSRTSTKSKERLDSMAWFGAAAALIVVQKGKKEGNNVQIWPGEGPCPPHHR